MPQLCLHSGAGTAAKLCRLPATELSAAPASSCAQYRPAALPAFPTSGPVYLRCVPPAAVTLYLHLDSSTHTTAALQDLHLGLAYQDYITVSVSALSVIATALWSQLLVSLSILELVLYVCMYNPCTVSTVSQYTRASSLIAWLQRCDLNSVSVSVSGEKS